MTTNDIEAVQAPSFAPSDALAELRAKAQSAPQPTPLPARLPWHAITQLPALFQPRGIAEWHVSELARVIRTAGEVDPVTVLQVGHEAVLIDGHHRIAAYELAAATESIPVRYFEGSLEEAVLEAGEANSKTKLPMTSQERQDYAWRLVLIGQYSKAAIARASGASPSQVANMRKVRRTLGDAAFEHARWWHARARAQGGDTSRQMPDEEREAWLEEQANAYADRLAREFGTGLARNPEVAARALAVHLGRRLGEVFAELKGLVSEWEEPDGDLESDF